MAGVCKYLKGISFRDLKTIVGTFQMVKFFDNNSAHE